MKKGFKIVVKSPKVRVVPGLLGKAGRKFRSGKVYNRKEGKKVER